jgi:hypothetical protein
VSEAVTGRLDEIAGFLREIVDEVTVASAARAGVELTAASDESLVALDGKCDLARRAAANLHANVRKLRTAILLDDDAEIGDLDRIEEIETLTKSVEALAISQSRRVKDAQQSIVTRRDASLQASAATARAMLKLKRT